MLNVIADLKQQLADRTKDVTTIQETHHTLQEIIDELKEKATAYNNLREEAENALKYVFYTCVPWPFKISIIFR